MWAVAAVQWILSGCLIGAVCHWLFQRPAQP
jgi:hypothetical protein